MSIVLVLVILQVNLVTPQAGLDSPNAINTLGPGVSESVFALQILQIRTTEETPAAPAGNNRNVFRPGTSLDVQENFRAISPLHPIEGTSDGKKMKNDEHADVSLLSSAEGNFFDRTESGINDEINGEFTESLNLIWDNCYGRPYKGRFNTGPKTYMNKGNSHSLEMNDSKVIGNILNKRNSLNANNTSTLRAWLEKYNLLKNSRTTETTESIALTATTEPVIITTEPTIPTTEPITTTTQTVLLTTNISSTLQVIPITNELVNDYSQPYSVTVVDFVTENSIKEPYTQDWFATTDKSKIKFTSLPQTQTYLIPKFKLEEGFYPFSFMTKFFSVIYLFDYPVGLVKDMIWGRNTFPYSFLQSIKVESTFLVFIIIFGCFALIIPLYLLIISLISLFSKSKCTDEIESGALFLEPERPDCHDKIIVTFTFFFWLICCALISGMVLTNEQSHMAIAESRNVISCACADVASWLSTAAQELHLSLVPPVDMVFYAYKEDLSSVENLLGEPIQQAIASESGIDLVLDSLADIITESEDLSAKISALRDVCNKAGILAATSSERIKDLIQQLDNLKKYCIEKDAPLCDTLNANSLRITMKFDAILQEYQLLELRTLGVQNLSQAISLARREFRTLPAAISSQTEHVRSDVLRDIEYRRQIVHNSARVLSDIVRHLTSGLHTLARVMDSGLDRLHKYELWRWIIMLACNVALAFVMIMIIFALFCGCGNAKIHAKRTLQVSSFCLCIFSLALWSVVSGTFLIAGHAEVFACQMLWDTPQYKTLSKLLDRPSPLLQDKEGIFDVLFKDLNNVTIEVSVKDVLRECEKNEPAYTVFQLDKILDVNKETSYFEWDELQDDLRKLSTSIDVGFLKTISDNFNKLLNRILSVSDVNLTKYRMDYNGPVVGKDLPSFVDQLENVAVQVTDLNTAGRLETLATRTQRLHLSNIKPLEQLRTELVFKLTELELQMMPFRRKLNISLSHIHTAQFYIDNQGDVIAQKKLSTFISRLISHTAGWRTHVLNAASQHAGRCGPLFAVFAALRSLICTKYVSSLHGWWFSGFLLGFVWCTVFTPLCVKLWRAYSKKLRALDSLTLANLAQEPGTPATAPCEDTAWNSPEYVKSFGKSCSPPPPPRNDSW